jgi:hypothetical protein
VFHFKTPLFVVAAALHDFGNRDKIPPSITSSIGNILALCEENVKETGRPEEKIGRTDKKALLRVSDFLFVKNSKKLCKAPLSQRFPAIFAAGGSAVGTAEQ